MPKKKTSAHNRHGLFRFCAKVQTHMRLRCEGGSQGEVVDEV